MIWELGIQMGSLGFYDSTSSPTDPWQKWASWIASAQGYSKEREFDAEEVLKNSRIANPMTGSTAGFEVRGDTNLGGEIIGLQIL